MFYLFICLIVQYVGYWPEINVIMMMMMMFDRYRRMLIKSVFERRRVWKPSRFLLLRLPSVVFRSET